MRLHLVYVLSVDCGFSVSFEVFAVMIQSLPCMCYSLVSSHLGRGLLISIILSLVIHVCKWNTCIHKQLYSNTFLLLSPLISPVFPGSWRFLSQSSSQKFSTFMILPHPSGWKIEKVVKSNWVWPCPVGAMTLLKRRFPSLRVLAFAGFLFLSTLATIPATRLLMGWDTKGQPKKMELALPHSLRALGVTSFAFLKPELEIFSLILFCLHCQALDTLCSG